MQRTHTTIAGDMIDAIAYRTYGYRPGSVEAILEANPGLCELSPMLPAGVVITLPDLPPPVAPSGVVRLWD